MTWEDVWEKYETQIMEQEKRKANENNSPNDINEEEVMMRIYMRILEKSCATNQAFDGMFLKDGNGEGEDDLAAISSQLQQDIQSILLSEKEAEKVMRRRNKIEKDKVRAIEKEEKERAKAVEKEQKRKRKLETRMRKRKEEKLKRKLEKRMKRLSIADE